MDERARRIVESEVLFRKVNEQVHSLSKEFQVQDERIAIICECGELSCVSQIELSTREYANVRADATHFAVLPGHEQGGIETVVLETDRYIVVEKAAGEPAALARALGD